VSTRRSGWLLAAVLCGCPTPLPTTVVDHHGPARRFASPAQLLKQVIEVNDGYGTLTTVQQVTLEIALGGDRSEKRSFSAALAIRRPGGFRLQILGPMGVRLVDLLYLKGQTKVLHVEPALQRSSQLPAILDSIAGDIRAIYHLDPLPRVDHRRMEESVSLASGSAPLLDLKEYRGRELTREMDIFASTLAMARSQVVEGTDIRTVTYGAYEARGRLMVPRQIHVAKEGSVFYWLSIQVESVTIDEGLDREIFTADEN